MRIATLIVSLILPAIAQAGEIGTALSPVTIADLPQGAHVLAEIQCGNGSWQAYGEFDADAALIRDTLFFECTDEPGTDTTGQFPYIVRAPRT